MRITANHRRRAAMASGATVILALATFASAAPAVAQDLTETIAKAAGVPQMDAFLPDKYSVEESEALPIDGVWMISSIKKKIRIEKGRAYAVDSWLHLFTLKVQPDMVVLQNFQRTGPGKYTADDLPLLGPATFQLKPDGNMSVNVKGTLGPVAYGLIKREADNPAALAAEIAAAAGSPVSPPPPAAPAPTPAPEPITDPEPAPEPVTGEPDPFADCSVLDVNRDTGEIFCADE